MSLAAGELNRQIIIEKRSGLLDALNRPLADDWIPHVTKWAAVRGQTGMGVIRGSASGVENTVNAYSYRVRYDTTITTAMRVVEGTDRYDIVDVRHDKDRHDWTDIVVKSGNDG